ncbi:hypothetical protein Focb16_v016514 [Fusarium oxysporum f. sp. cubense]|uniref:Uncharacterized protein n=1 Tax=Fusarium oxysporum f. sp. cubense TaxID=61366 RepID=A0A559KXJ4_FUSOC|nr:hypothetical protein Focb16_v016514 [Fusarium oxysporum f. sp. cubense]
MLEAVGDLDDTGVWKSITVSDPSSNTTVLLQATLYMTSFQAQGMENIATRTTPRLAEPSLVWDPPTAKCNTKTVLQQLGTTTSEIPIAQRRTFHFASPLRRKQPNSLVSGDSMETNDGIYSADWDPLYAGMVNSAQFSIFSVLVVVMTHLILVLLVILMSRLSGVPGRFQKVWASISQLLRSVTEDWIREADTVDDKIVELWLNDLGLHNVLLGIEYVQCRVYLVNKQKVS